jgi:hypothetical protein
MDGQKKSEHMTGRIRDLALGEIHPRDELALLAHVAECDACRDAYNHAGAVRSFVDRGLEKLVGGVRESEPSSPQFAARLRARIAAEPAPGRWHLNVLRMWEPAARRPLYYVVGAAAVALLIAFAMNSLVHRERSTPSAPPSLVAQIPGASAPPSTPAPSPTVPTAAPSNPAAGAPQRAVNPDPQPAANSQAPRAANAEHAPATPASRTPESRAPNSRANVSRPAPGEPEVLVPKDELRAVAQLYAATQSGRVDSEQLYTAQQQARQPLEWKPIEITPLKSLAPDSEKDSTKGPGLF